MGQDSHKRKKRPDDDDDGTAAQRQRRRMIQEAAQETNGDSHNIDSQNDSNISHNSQQTLQQTCDLIAELSESIVENPEAAFGQAQSHSPQKQQKQHSNSITSPVIATETERLPSPMRQLLAIAATQNNPHNQYTAHLAIMSLLAVFKDILPSYRIRLPTQQEMAVKVSKETKHMWDYEKALLQHYQQFLKLLQGTWNRHKRRKGTTTDEPKAEPNHPSRVATTAMLTMAELLKTAFAFNFGTQLLIVVVRATNHTSAIGDACCQAIQHVFVHDAQGQIAREAAQLVAKMVHKRNFQVRPAVLRTFLALPLRVHGDEVQAAKLAAQAKAKKRKKDRELAEIEQEMREGDATVDKMILARAQADTLQAVTLTYFRILKSTESVPDHVLPAALEGLAKFAHLINMDTVTDVLTVLRQFLLRERTLPLPASLNCILTAFVTLQGPGKELKIDHKEYIAPLYHQIPRLTQQPAHSNNSNSSSHNDNPNCTDLVVQCVTAAFIKRREFSVVRVCAFVKQLLTTALHTPPPTAVPLLALVRQIVQRYPAAQQLLENEQDVLTSGEYTPEAADPELTNPLATSAWELATLRFHGHPQIQQQAHAASAMQLLRFPAESPDRLARDMMDDHDALYIPYRPILKKHPLLASISKDKKKAKPRFIKARYRNPKCHSSMTPAALL